jgi:hypothetical protein
VILLSPLHDDIAERHLCHAPSPRMIRRETRAFIPGDCSRASFNWSGPLWLSVHVIAHALLWFFRRDVANPGHGNSLAYPYLDAKGLLCVVLERLLSSPDIDPLPAMTVSCLFIRLSSPAHPLVTAILVGVKFVQNYRKTSLFGLSSVIARCDTSLVIVRIP